MAASPARPSLTTYAAAPARSSTHPRARPPRSRPTWSSCPVVGPRIYWTWSLVWRRCELRATVLAVVDALTDGIGDLGINAPGARLPDGDPYKR